MRTKLNPYILVPDILCGSGRPRLFELHSDELGCSGLGEPRFREGPSFAFNDPGKHLVRPCAQRKTPSTLPPSETAAEREKRWRKHLQTLDLRGERYTGEEDPRDPRREEWRRGIV